MEPSIEEIKETLCNIRGRCKVCLYLETYGRYILYQFKLEEAKQGNSLFWYANTQLAVREVHDQLASSYKEILVSLHKSICREYNDPEMSMLDSFAGYQKLLKTITKDSSNYKYLNYTLYNIEEMCRGIKIIQNTSTSLRLPLEINLSCIPFIQMAQDTILALLPVDKKDIFESIKDEITFEYKFNKINK